MLGQREREHMVRVPHRVGAQFFSELKIILGVSGFELRSPMWQAITLFISLFITLSDKALNVAVQAHCRVHGWYQKLQSERKMAVCEVFYGQTIVYINKSKSSSVSVFGVERKFFIVFILLFRTRWVREVVGSVVNDDTWIKLGLVLIFFARVKSGV